MRIIAGTNRGTNLFVPDIEGTRPTMDRTRQAVFNILRSAPWAMRADGAPLLHDAMVLDVFAGSGAMGFEALSQGAASATFFEMNPIAIEAIEKNRHKLRRLDVTRLLKGDVLKTGIHGSAAHIAFFDPPYGEGMIFPAVKQLAAKNFIDKATLCVLEMGKTEELAGSFDIEDIRIYGTSKIVFARLQD